MVYNNGKPYEQMDDLGGFPTIFGNTHMKRRVDGFDWNSSSEWGETCVRSKSFLSHTLDIQLNTS